MALDLPAVVDLTVYAGATWRQQFRWSSDGDYVDLSGYTAAMQVRAARAQGVTQVVEYDSLVAELTTGNGGITLNSPTGTVALFMSAATTAGLPAALCRYDVELTETATGEVYRLVMGSLTVSEEVTRG